MKVRVPKYGAPQQFVTVDPAATRGATIGVDVFNRDGSLFVPGAAATPADRFPVTVWRLVQEIPVNVQAVEALATDGFVRRAGATWTAAAIVNVDLDGADTDGLSEGATNQYFTNARADARVSAGIQAFKDAPALTVANLANAVDDAAAATAGVAVGSLYRNGSALMIRVA